jgi:flagellar hook assembly protein FlgD
LNADSKVQIKMFDLLGYQVREWSFDAGQQGGKAGPNVFSWDGSSSGGQKVAAGGYVLRIQVIGEKGTTEIIRMIGVTH